MASLTKTTGIVLLPWQDVPNGNVVLSSPHDVSTRLAATVFVKLARRSGSPFSPGWPNLRLEASSADNGTSDWFPLAQFQPAPGSSIANTTLSGAISAGAASCVVNSASNLAAGDLLFLGYQAGPDTTRYELVRVKTVSGTTITFEEPCTYAHDNGAPVTDQAELFVAQFDLTAIGRLRAVIDNAASSQTLAAEVRLTTGDTIG